VSETTWHFIGTTAEVTAQAPMRVSLDNQRVAVFVHDGQVRAISDRCNHKGGPLSEGFVKGEYVTCPWHGWEYSVVTGRGPAGFDEEQVASYAVETRPDGVYVRTPPVEPKKLKKHKPSHLLHEHPKEPGAPVRVLGLSATGMDDDLPRYSTSEALLETAMAHAASLGADTQTIRLRQLAFRECEGNYSKAAPACTWPCAITERDPKDQMEVVYEGLVHWADVVILATPIRWGQAGALYFKMAERLNCVQNQITIANKVLIDTKVASFIITGGQDNIQGVAGDLLGFWAELGFVFPPFPYIGHSRGWTAEDMQNNVRFVRRSVDLREGAQQLVERSLDTWRALDAARLAAAPMSRAGRKANAAH
jgi:nitrite reductase/ring-hydroxylating ferredoxin subunit/multimeric flavodoxin WrbA